MEHAVRQFRSVSHPFPAAPSLEPEGLTRWRGELETSRVYLEYGSGASTLIALSPGRTVVTVETDRRFLRHVVCRAEGVHGPFYPLHADIGLTEDFGKPVFKTPTPWRRWRWSRYPDVPWRLLQRLGLVPDLILIDGRFRVASVLASLMNLPPASPCRLLLDDFGDRQERYDAVLEFAEDVQLCGRMLAFRKARAFSGERCLAVRRGFAADYW